MISFYNTLSKKEEIFTPLKDKKVNFFVCGPTTYDLSHIGHARTYIIYDALVKFLKAEGFKVFYLQNITNIDDKIIKRAKEEKKDPLELSAFYEKEYYTDIESLKINSVSKYAKATDYIPQIIDQVKRLIEKGVAYQIEDGIYYDISKFKNYGKLSGRTIEQAEDAVSRIDQSKNKKNKGDFCLWKFAKEGEPFWQSPWGKGRPGWHIEDTAISEYFFGQEYDIHGGGQDLIFPHHEAEIAQMEILSNKPLAKYWLHTGMLTVEGKKMAKSLKNYITIKEFLSKFSPQTLRLLIFKTHWHSPLDYKEEKAKEAQKNEKELKLFVEKLSYISKEKNLKSKKTLLKIKRLKKSFWKSLEENFNTPEALSQIFELINFSNPLIEKGALGYLEAQEIILFLKEVNSIFEIIDFKKTKFKIPKEVESLIKKREELRKEKNFQKADEIRKIILEKGYIIEDTKEGPRVYKK